MSNEKTPEELRKEKAQPKVQNQITENTFEDRSHIPSEQNRFKDTENPRSERN